MMDLYKFFKENDVAIIDGIYAFKDKNRRNKAGERPFRLIKGTNRIIHEIHHLFRLFNINKVRVTSVDAPLMVDIIRTELGCSRAHAYKLANTLYCIWIQIR